MSSAADEQQQQPQQPQQPHQQASGGTAFQVAVDGDNIAPSSGRPHHLVERLEDREVTSDVIVRRQTEAEERRKRKEEELVKRVSMHHEKVEKISKDAEERKKRESVS